MNKLKKKSDRKLRSIQAFAINCSASCGAECNSSGDTSGYASATANSWVYARLNG